MVRIAKWLVLLTVGFVIGCAPTPTVRVDELSRTQERFLELAFTPEPTGLLGKLSRPHLYIRPEYTLSIRGNAAEKFEHEIDAAIKFYSQIFNIRRVSDTDDTANVVLFLEAATSGGPKDAFVNRVNTIDSHIFDRNGWTFKRNNFTNAIGTTNTFSPLEASHLRPGKYQTRNCVTYYLFDDVAVQQRNGGRWGARTVARHRNFEFPDYAVAYIFTGLSDAFQGTVSEEGAKRLAEQKAIVPICIFEEIGHALTFFADVYSPFGEVPFNLGEYVGWDQKKETLTVYITREYAAQLPEIKRLFRLIADYRLTNGMTRDDVIARFAAR